MSYILDALRRADAERERGSVPSIHAQTTPPAPSDDVPRPAGRPMAWVAAGLSIALLASTAWHFVGREPTRDTVDADAAAPAPAPMGGPAMQPASPAPTLPAVAPPMATQAARTSLPPVPAPAPAPPMKAAAPPVAAPTAPSAPAPAANARIPTQDELPADIRNQLPKFVVGGSIYSESAASRFLILNGQIFHENDKVMPELVLEQIKLKSAVLRYRNQRFSISY